MNKNREKLEKLINTPSIENVDLLLGLGPNLLALALTTSVHTLLTSSKLVFTSLDCFKPLSEEGKKALVSNWEMLAQSLNVTEELLYKFSHAGLSNKDQIKMARSRRQKELQLIAEKLENQANINLLSNNKVRQLVTMDKLKIEDLFALSDEDKKHLARDEKLQDFFIDTEDLNVTDFFEWIHANNGTINAETTAGLTAAYIRHRNENCTIN